MKSYKELITETLNQRSIVDNRSVVDVADVTPSVLIAFNRACSEMRDMHNWVWNFKEDTYRTQVDNTSYPMPYGIVKGLSIAEDEYGKNKCPLDFVTELTAEEGCPSQWTHDWASEEIIIAPAEKDSGHWMTIKYYDKNIACVGPRTDPNVVFLPEFDPSGTTYSTENQFLNVPAYIYEAYAKCVTTLTRVYLNENAQPTVFEAQKQEFKNAYNSLLEYAKTPFYDAQKVEI
jgi:hypothetical protein